MAEEGQQPAAEEQEEEESGGSNKLVTILTITNVVISLGIAIVVFLGFKKEQSAPRVEDMATEGDSPEAEGGHGGGHGEAKGGEHGGGKSEAKGGEHGGGHGGAKSEAKTNHNFGKMISLEQFTVNLATTGTVKPKFARVSLSIEVPSEDTELEVNQKMPQVRNTIIDLFNSKQPSDLQTPESRNLLKEQIQNALNSFIVTGKVRGVFFTSFALSS